VTARRIRQRHRIYLDACCLNRPFDDQGQARIQLESDAVLIIIERVAAAVWVLLGSDVLLAEIAAIPDPVRRDRVATLARYCSEVLTSSQAELERAEGLERAGFHGMDALHIACAERMAADTFLTTDDALLRCARRNVLQLRVTVANPAHWVLDAGI